MIWATLLWLYIIWKHNDPPTPTSTKNNSSLAIKFAVFATLWTVFSPWIHVHYNIVFQVRLPSISTFECPPTNSNSNCFICLFLLLHIISIQLFFAALTLYVQKYVFKMYLECQHPARRLYIGSFLTLFMGTGLWVYSPFSPPLLHFFLSFLGSIIFSLKCTFPLDFLQYLYIYIYKYRL